MLATVVSPFEGQPEVQPPSEHGDIDYVTRSTLKTALRAKYDIVMGMIEHEFLVRGDVRLRKDAREAAASVGNWEDALVDTAIDKLEQALKSPAHYVAIYLIALVKDGSPLCAAQIMFLLERKGLVTGPAVDEVSRTATQLPDLLLNDRGFMFCILECNQLVVADSRSSAKAAVHTASAWLVTWAAMSSATQEVAERFADQFISHDGAVSLLQKSLSGALIMKLESVAVLHGLAQLGRHPEVGSLVGVLESLPLQLDDVRSSNPVARKHVSQNSVHTTAQVLALITYQLTVDAAQEKLAGAVPAVMGAMLGVEKFLRPGRTPYELPWALRQGMEALLVARDAGIPLWTDENLELRVGIQGLMMYLQKARHLQL
mmetsp:Transcript_40344/g.96816  ORF Transcript_40344/g.96816 Transcript_40344/m.96816 type:complete len:373 (+) Transcript_40344:27-1145(+)